MKIAWIRIKGFQQFEDTFIDFRHPETGKALDKICLIGRNGTGKSTVLAILQDISVHIQSKFKNSPRAWQHGNCLVKFEFEDDKNYIAFGCDNPDFRNNREVVLLREEVEKHPDFFTDFNKAVSARGHNSLGQFNEGMFDYDLLTFCPSESPQNYLISLGDVPQTNINDALSLFKNFRTYNLISNETVADFWRLLIYLIKKREDDRSEFENDSSNIEKTKKQLIEEFDGRNPDILKAIAALWNEILEKASLKFDHENAKKPTQLTDNLHAYIVNNNGKRVNYNKLSTGVRNFIFRFGHIKTLYFDREVKRGLLLVDEPENSLFPDFLLDIIEKYGKVTTDKNGERNTQMFFATHSPIIASQFEPHERIILDWDEDGSVKARKGTAPEGDDPNDILYQDFGMTEIVSKKGQEVWKAYLDLKKKLSREKDDSKKKEIAEEILKIGREYNFN